MKSIFRLTPVRAVAWMLCALAFSVHAQPSSAQSKNSPTLSFDLAASATRPGSQSTPRAADARVHLSGERARIETQLGAQDLLVLLQPPYVYRLLPDSKSGVRYKASTPMPELGFFAANWQELMREPRKIRALLQHNGARKTGNATLNNTKTEVYSASKWNGHARKMKLWIRQSDGLPMRLETDEAGMKITLNWKNYRRGHALAPSLFAVPKDYRIRDGRPPRNLL